MRNGGNIEESSHFTYSRWRYDCIRWHSNWFQTQTLLADLLGRADSDVIENLETALLAASTSNCGVWVAFNKKIINAVRATKIDIGVNCLDAFASNHKDEVHISDFLLNDHALNKGQGETFSTAASEAVEIFCLSHTTKPLQLSRYLDSSAPKYS